MKVGTALRAVLRPLRERSLPSEPTHTAMTSSIHIPVLRLGQTYRSLDKIQFNVSGQPLEISVANSGLIRRDLQQLAKSGAALRAIPCETLVGYMEKAAELYLHGHLPWGDGERLQSPDDYVAALSQLTGLPHSLGRSNMGKVHAAMSNIRAVISGLTRGMPLELFDRALGWLKAQEEVDGARLAIVGGSKGAEAALIVASRHPELRAVVAGMPSSVAPLRSIPRSGTS